MTKKIFNISGVLFAISTFAILFLPWIHTYYDGDLVSADMTTNGFGMSEFSVWGIVICVLPFIILGVAHCQLSCKEKTMFVLGLYLFGNISFHCAVSTSLGCLQSALTNYVRPDFWMALYPLFMFLSLASFYLTYNLNLSPLLQVIGVEECKDADITRNNL